MEDMTCHECNEGTDFFEDHTNLFANSGTTNPADWNTSSSLEPGEYQYQSDGEGGIETEEDENISQEDYVDYDSQESGSEDY